MFGVWLVGSGRDVLVFWLMCFGIFVIVGFWSNLKIVVFFTCLVAKKMQEEKKKILIFIIFWATSYLRKNMNHSGKVRKKMNNSREVGKNTKNITKV